MTVLSVPGQQLTANQWLFSAPVTVATDASSVVLQVTDPNNQWFTRPGNVKAWGVQMAGYVGGPWDDQDPWLGWGWWLYDAGATGDPKQALLLPAAWTPFGAALRGFPTLPRLRLGIDAPAVTAAQGKQLRFVMQTDANIRLGLDITLT